MTDHQPFINAILCDPESDDLRLGYADWLEEGGQVERAEFIRVQCQLADATVFRSSEDIERLDQRERELLMHRSAAEWMPKPLRPFSVAFQRGFVESISCTAADWLQHGQEIVRCQPIRELPMTGPIPEEALKLWRMYLDLADFMKALRSDELSPRDFDAADPWPRAALLWARQDPCPECDGEGFWVNLFYQRVNCGRCNGKGSIDFRTLLGKSPAPILE